MFVNHSHRKLFPMHSIRPFILKALTPMAVVLGLGLYFRQEVVDSILFTPHPAIVFVIFALSGIGLLLLLLNMTHLWQDQRVLSRVLSLAPQERMERLQALQREPGRFSALAGLLVTPPVWDRREHQAACETELDRIQYFYNEALSFPAFLSGALVGLGLVGTFIGLLGALGDIADLISGLSVMNSQSGNMMEMFAQLVKQLQNPMKSMATAFVASLYGLLGSMTLGFTLFAHRKFVPLLVNQWRSLAGVVLLDDAAERLPEGATPAENLQIALTEAEQWKRMFAQLRAEHQQLIEHSQQLQQQSTRMIGHMREQQNELLMRQDERHQESLLRQEAWHEELLKRQELQHCEMQQHTEQQVLQIQAETRDLAKVLHERNETDALVRRALGEGEHWMQTLMQLQETALRFVTDEQERSAIEVAATRACTDATQRLIERLQRTDERQQHDVQQLAREVRELVDQIQRVESTAGQLSAAVLHNVQAHQVALQDSIAKLRTLMALAMDEPGMSTAPISA